MSGSQAVAFATSPRGSTSTSVEVVTDFQAFLRLEEVWNQTVERADIAHPFLRHEWLRTWWECFGAGTNDRRLHIVVVRSDEEILAIAPLMWEAAQMYGVPIRRVALLQNDHTPRADFIVTDRPEESYRAIWHALRGQHADWDVLQLSLLPEESPTRATMSRLAAADGYSSGVWQHGDSPYLGLTGSWDAYFETLSSKFRQNLRNRLSRLTRLGEPALEILSDREAIRDACHDAVRLEDSGWKQTEGTAIASESAVHRFYQLLAERGTDAGWLRLLFLRVGDHRIATSYACWYHRRLFLCKTGYDPDYAKCSPFKLLTYFALREAFAAGLTELDFLGDPEPWKLEWTTTIRPHDWLFIFSNTWRARLLSPVKFQLVPALKRVHVSRAAHQ